VKIIRGTTAFDGSRSLATPKNTMDAALGLLWGRSGDRTPAGLNFGIS
jgi:hypothetical protein